MARNEKEKTRRAEYYARHKEEILARQAVYRAEHRSEIAAYDHEYGIKNKAKISERGRKYHADHKPEISERMKKYSSKHDVKIGTDQLAYRILGTTRVPSEVRGILTAQWIIDKETRIKIKESLAMGIGTCSICGMPFKNNNKKVSRCPSCNSKYCKENYAKNAKNPTWIAQHRKKSKAYYYKHNPQAIEQECKNHKNTEEKRKHMREYQRARRALKKSLSAPSADNNISGGAK